MRKINHAKEWEIDGVSLGKGVLLFFFFFNKESERTSYAIIQPQVQFKRYKLRAHANSVKHYLEF